MDLACMFAESQATEQRCDASGSVQMQACDHEGVSSCERDPHGDRMRPLFFGSLVNILLLGERAVTSFPACLMWSGRK